MTAERPHPLAVSRAAKLADRAVAAIWRKGAMSKPPLEPDYLWRIGSRGYTQADEHGGRRDEDVADFRERLDRLCQSLQRESQLNALGHTMAYGQLTSAIRKRHALGRLWRERPEVATAPIAPPIVVLGQMRAGTTRIHRLLAADPAHVGTRFCNSVDPVPRRPDHRPFKSALGLAIARRINPWLDTLHPFGATRVDEEIGWLSAALSPCAYEAQWHIPTFVAWSEARDPSPIYREFVRILRTDAAAMKNEELSRVLKCPQFAEDSPALLSAFPDARFVEAHRASDEVLESAVSLVASQSAFQSDHADLANIRSEWMRKLGLRAQRMDAARPRTSPVVVKFDALNADWRGAIAQLYRSLGLFLSDAARVAMEREQRYSARSPHLSHGAALKRFARQQP
ncbi:sulfotransferase family protein [Tsuneonella sp. HG249]